MTIHNSQLKANNKSINIPDLFGTLDYEVRRNKAEKPLETVEAMNQEIQQLFQNLQDDGADNAHLNDFQEIIRNGLDYEDSNNMHVDENGKRMNVAQALSSYVEYDKQLNPDKRKNNLYRFSRLSNLANVQDSYVGREHDKDGKRIALAGIHNHEKGMLAELSGGNLDTIEHQNLIPSVFNVMSKYADPTMTDRDARLLYDHTVGYLSKAKKLEINKGANYIKHPELIADSLAKYYAQATPQEQQQMDNLTFPRANGVQQHVFYNHGHSVYENSVVDLVKNHYSLYVRGLSREMEDYNPVRNLSQQLEETMAHSDATKAGYSPISFNDLRKCCGTPGRKVHVGNKIYKAADNGALKLVDRNGDEHYVNEKIVNGQPTYAMRDFEQTIKHDDYYSFLRLNDKLYNDGKHDVAQLNRVKNYIETGIDSSKEQDATKVLSNLMLEDNAIYPKNVDLQNGLKDYLSRSNTTAFENLINEGQLTGISAREVRQFESGVRYLQNNNLDYTLNAKNGALVASVPSNGASMQLTGQYAGSVAKSVDGTLLTYNTSTITPIKFIFDAKYKDTPDVQDTWRYLIQNSIPFESYATANVAPDVKDLFDNVAAIKNEKGEIVKDEDGKTKYHAHSMLMFGDANGQFDNPNKLLAVGYDANRLNSLTMHTDAMDVACGLHSPVSGKLVQNEGASVFKSSFIGNGTEYRVTPHYGARMFGDDREFSNQAEAQAELTKALNDARKMAFNDEIKRVFNSNPRNRDLLYAAANVNRFVKDEDGIDKNVEENIQHTIEQLNPTQKAANQAVDVFSKLYAEDAVHGYSEERLNQALSQIVNEGGYDTQGAINLKRMYQLTAKYVDDHVGRTINYFDPQYVKSAITNTTTESLDYATKLMKAAGVKGPNLFTHGDQIALNRTIDNLVSFDENSAKTADELRNNQHDFEKETRDGFEAYLSRRYSGLELPISRVDILKQAGITFPENTNVGALYQAAAERNPVALSNARQALVDQEFTRVQALDKQFADNVDLTQVDQINTQEARELTAYRELKSILTDRASSVDNDLADQLDFIQGVLKDQGLDDVKVRIDGNGVVEWTGDLDKSFTAKRDGVQNRYHFNVPARGEIGQLYGRDDQGVMQLRYASGDQRFKSAGNISYYSFDGSDRQERFRVKLPQDVQREVLRSELNTQLGRLNKIGGISVDNFAYEVAVTKYMQEHPGTTREDFDRERQDKNGDVYKSKQALKKGIAIDENGIPASQSKKPTDHYEMFASPADRAAMISTLNGGGRSDVLTLSNASDVTAMSRLYSKEMYGQEINLRVLAHAHRPEASYQASNISQDLEKARVEEAKHKTLYDNNFAKAAGATSLSPDMPHSTYNSTEARLAGRQMVGESQVADATWADENATGSGANQGRQQTMQKPVLEKTEKRRDQRDLEQNALIKPADGEQYKLDTQDLHEVKGYDDPDGRSAIDTALTEMGLMSYLKYNAADRVNMFYKNMEQATNMGQANVAMMTFGGFTAEDSIVVSKKMAERMQIIGKNGEYRPLRAGDKLSDLHGNKGVISLVVDPDMPDDQAAAEGLTDEVKFFRDNPNVDMVGDPESVMSRANMGLAHEAMDHPVGKVNGMDVDIGTRTMLVTDKAADKDAHVAGTNEAGRSQGGLFQAALVEANCPELSKQLIGDRNNGFEKLSNLAEGLGYRLTPEGALINEETARNCDDDDHEIKTFDLEAEYEKAKALFDAGKSLDDTYFSRAVQKNGSVVLKPNANKLLADAAQYDHVDIKMPQSGLNVQIGNNNTKVELKNERLPLKLFDPKTNKYSKTSDTISLVPVSDREERDLESGKASGLTKMYSKMINSAWNARYATDIAADELKAANAKYQNKLPKNKTYEQLMRNEMTKNSVVRMGRYENSARMFGQNAQREIQRQVGGTGAEKDTSLQKAMRNHLLKPSEPNSGTLTAHADPRLSIDEVMIPQKLASQMHMQDGSVVLLQRDPIQKVGNIRTVNVRVNDDPNFQGIAMHPVIVKSFDGDFDGDKYGLTKIDLDPNNEALMNEVESLRPHNNLLDRLYTKEDADKKTQGDYAGEAGVMLNLSVEETAGMVAAVEKYQQTGENVLADNTLFDPDEYLKMRQEEIAKDPEAAQLSEQDGLTQATVSDQTKEQAKNSNHSVAKALGAFTVADYVERKVKAKAQSIEKMPIEQRQRQADNLSKSIQQLEHANVGAIHLNCANEGATRDSLVRMVETGAKGSMGKVENDMHYYHGFDDQPRGEHSVLLYNYDKDGHQLRPLNEREAPKMTEHRLYQDETHKAMRIKTDFTAIAGAIEQRMLASAMSVSPRECSEIAAGFYQDLLQAKHDPNDAVKRVKHTQDLGKLLSGRNPKTNYPYRDVNNFKRDMKELVIGTVGCKVGGTVIDQMCDKMFDKEKGRSISIEQAFKGDQTAYGQFMFGHGTKTLTELMKATESEIPEGRKKSLGAYKTFVKERIGEKAVKEGNQAAEITINNMIPSDFQPKEDAIEQAHQMREVRTNEAVHSADEQRENVQEDSMGISHEHDHDMPSMGEE